LQNWLTDCLLAEKEAYNYSNINIRGLGDRATALFDLRFSILGHFCDLENIVALRYSSLSVKSMNVFVMAAQISTLSECLLTNLTLEWAHIRMLAEVVPQVAALAKECLAVRKLAAEVELDSLGIFVANLDHLMPIRRDTIKFFIEV
jgi:hypothetical protein